MDHLLQSKQKVYVQPEGRTCVVEQFLEGGGGGEVYAASIDCVRVELKWYFFTMATSDQRAVIETLMSIGSPGDNFVWPLGLATSPKVPGFGYITPLRDERYKRPIDLLTGRISPIFRSLTTAALQLAESFRRLHDKRLCFLAFDFGSFCFDPDNGDVLVCYRGFDVVQQAKAAAPCGAVKFTAPENIRGTAGMGAESDLFILSVILFYLLVRHHPLDGNRESSTRIMSLAAIKKLYGEEPVFIFDPDDDSNRPSPEYHRNAIELWPIYPRFLRDLFARAFTVGLHDPKSRVSEEEWMAAMVRLRDSIMRCSHCNSDMFYDHDVYKENRGALAPCLDCSKVPDLPPRMRIDGQKTVIVLDQGSKICPHHIKRLKEFDFSRELAVVVPHPQDPVKIGLKNLSNEKWVFTSKDGAAREVAPGSIMQIDEGMKVNFAGLTGEFRIKT